MPQNDFTDDLSFFQNGWDAGISGIADTVTLESDSGGTFEFLRIVSDFMATCIKMFDVTAQHTHNAPSGRTSGPNEASDMQDQIEAAAAEKSRTDLITL